MELSVAKFPLFSVGLPDIEGALSSSERLLNECEHLFKDKPQQIEAGLFQSIDYLRSAVYKIKQNITIVNDLVNTLSPAARATLERVSPSREQILSAKETLDPGKQLFEYLLDDHECLLEHDLGKTSDGDDMFFIIFTRALHNYLETSLGSLFQEESPIITDEAKHTLQAKICPMICLTSWTDLILLYEAKRVGILLSEKNPLIEEASKEAEQVQAVIHSILLDITPPIEGCSEEERIQEAVRLLPPNSSKEIVISALFSAVLPHALLQIKRQREAIRPALAIVGEIQQTLHTSPREAETHLR